MGWDNPVIPWAELEETLSWGRYGEAVQNPRKQKPQTPTPVTCRHSRDRSAVPWAELHCHSHFSFLDGASSPDELVDEALRLGVHALAITDHDGFYGAVQFKEAAKGTDLKTVFGAELSLGLQVPRTGVPDPRAEHLLVLARDAEGYRRLSQQIGDAQLAGGEKGKPVYDLEALAQAADGHWAILTGCRKGAVRSALERHGRTEAGGRAVEAELRRLMDLFGPEHVHVELIQQHLPSDDRDNALLAEAARRHGLPTVASNNVHYARPANFLLAGAMAALRARRSLDEMDSWLPAAPTAHLRSADEMLERFRHYPGIVERTAQLGADCAFDFKLVEPELPPYPVPDGYTEISYLRQLTALGARERYGREEENPKAYRQIAYELDVIEKLQYPGYFLIVRGITDFCRKQNILAQGRGSAANSAVCYALGITNVDPIFHKLVFERFLSRVRDGPPDIDVDIEASRREKVIQYVYDTYGRDRAAMVCNVITYRGRLALRDAARVLGYSPGTVDAWAGQMGPHEPLPAKSDQQPADQKPADEEQSRREHPREEQPREEQPPRKKPDPDAIPDQVLDLAAQLQRRPRHLGIHSGGMVIVDRPLSQVVPVEWARMADRTVLQWDKDDCAAGGLVKFDLLGLGMLGALHDAFDLVREHHGVELGLHAVPQDGHPEAGPVYAMLQDADSVGVFQVESRAQMSTLPRLKPKEFYDLVVEVALIRPGPIQGGAVHPYLRRRRGDEDVTFPHDSLEPVLRRTLGVVLFQEQAMQMAIHAAGFTATEADRLRQAMSSKRSPERMEELREALMAGMAAKGIAPDVAEDIYKKLHAFSGFGFPESHSLSMAHIVWCSAYVKRYYPAAFTAALLNNQPMGFYSTATLVSDAKLHDISVLRVDVNASRAGASLQDPVKPYVPVHRHASPHPQPAVRLGLSSVRDVGDDAAERIAAEREDHGRFADLEDFVIRAGLSRTALESLAMAGAFACFGLSRRQALWAAGALAGTSRSHLPGTAPGTGVPELDPLSPVEETIADLWATQTTPENHPIAHLRAELDERGIIRAADLRTARNHSLVRVAGLVTHRQRPPTARGTCFLGMEDETGLINVICPKAVWDRQKRVALNHGALIVHGHLERADDAVNIVAGRLEPLRAGVSRRGARDFR